MKISVWDTYVTRKDGKVMHFDILVDSNLKDEAKVFEYGNIYLKTKPFETEKLSAKECSFCHIEQTSGTLQSIVEKEGFAIIEMEGCH